MDEEKKEEKKLDYVRLWRTLMRIGLKQRFSEVRTQFFMKVATDGPCVYDGHNDLYDIIDHSYLFSMVPSLGKNLDLFIGENDKFKHYEYTTEDGDINIEYFANTSKSKLNKEFIDASNDNKTPDGFDYNIDGVCLNDTFKVMVKVETTPEPTEENENPEPVVEYVEHTNTGHLICIAESPDTVNPDNYPKVIKHELTHACLYEVRLNFISHMYDDMHLPSTWSDDDIMAWNEDLVYLANVLGSSEEDADVFREFVSDFLMYESDGQTKEKNPIKESRVPKTNNPNGKPRTTYRTLTPIDRFEEQHIDTLSEYYHDRFMEIINALRNEYDEYDKFLESCKMG